ncbi:glycerol-3-phosphate dehydrogenase subunit GlpB [Edwardsiella piscicida]|uniref:Anaerobic glycerol-3-phosphate dehydrogenase subunit B n=3 Tax=Edwardsiella TaxID=635 RepID=A0A0H3DTS4_EDWTF|nr:glycerol-3-phosphate dehydrogenase subunit GlpB [Edwardsiella piscicida]ACY85945.1 anaerobic glycerol-3-phosphate dehydrogenase subunit B [Edwardsiella tarda EIB202]ADM42911.1 Anaerobic glycerol-3-phosphate dehydrogenase subunit B [Edwardsiella tarda FL6-60]AGH75090.1 anaerobic glycerol-3-phosphate dehydrogenase subunit B [Edwardsiella piscicida C07-087]ARD18705.1 anaerobic glycerol-3-phosphate dehydrogenase subunit B [Edwardsiella piscicida]EKS7781319.1 glycerol-3-phosphate dehydrogenase s
MKFDTLMIGGGLAGLACGIRLAEAGQRCAIVSAGQSALHFSSGSFDLLSRLPDGTPVTAPRAAIDELQRQAPQHPYSLMGTERFSRYAVEAERLLERSGLALVGDHQRNHLRVTPLGTRRLTWLSPHEVPVSDVDAALPWRRILVAGIEGFLDFQPQLVASSLQEQGAECEVVELTLPALDRLRGNPSEFRAVNIARVLDVAENRRLLAEELNRHGAQADAILMPACVGVDCDDALAQLRAAVARPLMLLPTLPPSVLGIHIHQQLRRRFQALGGLIMPGDTVLRAEYENNRVARVYTRNHGDIPLRPRHVVLASGSFFSNGLRADFGGVREPVFGLDVISAADRSDWCSESMFAPQPYLQFGVRGDAEQRAAVNGAVVNNLYAAGAVLGGYDPIHQGCGAGVSLLTALHAAQQILAEDA